MIYQVKRILFKHRFIHNFIRSVHNDQNSMKKLFPLQSRALLKIAGEDAGIFLQGLITNDMRHFEEGAKSMYTMFLNNKGRVLFDTLIHKWNRDDTFVIECDKNVAGSLQKHLKVYKLKRRVDIADVSNELKVHALISNIIDDTVESENDVKIYKDPRLSDLGSRIISPAQVPEAEVAQIVGKDVEINENEEGYKYLRYKLGVGEGAHDLPPGTTFPLEVNCDYLHGVSFHKGCYIGQEVTARVHHTGVVRKRIMPIKFTGNSRGDLEKDYVISTPDNPKSNLGKLKGVLQDYGIGLLRVKEALDAKVLTVGNCSVEVIKPSWWPLEAPKDKQPVLKTE